MRRRKEVIAVIPIFTDNDPLSKCRRTGFNDSAISTPFHTAQHIVIIAGPRRPSRSESFTNLLFFILMFKSSLVSLHFVYQMDPLYNC